MTRLATYIRDAWECLIWKPPDGKHEGLEWLRDQEQEAREATEELRQQRIRQTERALLRTSDFLDNEFFSPPKDKGRR